MTEPYATDEPIVLEPMSDAKYTEWLWDLEMAYRFPSYEEIQAELLARAFLEVFE